MVLAWAATEAAAGELQRRVGAWRERSRYIVKYLRPIGGLPWVYIWRGGMVVFRTRAQTGLGAFLFMEGLGNKNWANMTNMDGGVVVSNEGRHTRSTAQHNVVIAVQSDACWMVLEAVAVFAAMTTGDFRARYSGRSSAADGERANWARTFRNGHGWLGKLWTWTGTGWRHIKMDVLCRLRCGRCWKSPVDWWLSAMVGAADCVLEHIEMGVLLVVRLWWKWWRGKF